MPFSSVFKGIYTFGVPAAIAIFLVYFVTSRVDQSLDMMQKNLDSHVSESNQLIETDEQIKFQLQSVTQILLSICVNTAKSSNERNACFGRQ